VNMPVQIGMGQGLLDGLSAHRRQVHAESFL
jgi:hypothetical protein